MEIVNKIRGEDVIGQRVFEQYRKRTKEKVQKIQKGSESGTNVYLSNCVFWTN